MYKFKIWVDNSVETVYTDTEEAQDHLLEILNCIEEDYWDVES